MTRRPPPWEWPVHPPSQVDRFLAAGAYGDESVPDRIARWARERTDEPALIDAGRTITYGDLGRSMEAVVAALAARGVEAGDRVALQLPSDSHFAAAYLGTVRLGAVAVLVHMAYGPSEIAPLIDHARPYAAIVAPATAKYDAPAAFGARADGADLLAHILVADGPEWAGVLDTRPAGLPIPRPEDPLILGYTSGTVAAPKAVAASHRMMLANNDRMAPPLGIEPGTRVVSASPYSHLFGIGVLSTVLAAGGTMVVMPPFTPEDMVAAIAGHDAQVLFAAPAHAASILNSRPPDMARIARLRRTYLGGATVSPDLAAAWEAAVPGDGHRAGQLFGMTETMMTLTTPVDWPALRRHAGVGIPESGLDVRVVDEAGAEMPPDREGFLQIRGYSVFAGYAGNPRETAASLDAEGWFTTGDLARRTTDGDFVITGRVKDVINRGGVKYNPTDLEYLIADHPAVEQAAIVPLPDPVLGERACLCVSLVPGAAFDLDIATAYLAERKIGKRLWPERVEIVDDMPLTPTRKVMKRRLVERILAQDAGAGQNGHEMP